MSKRKMTQNTSGSNKKIKDDHSQTWQISKETVKDRINHVFLNKNWCDCKFLVGSDQKLTFEAHKLFLAMSSPVFEAMFYGKMANDTVVIEDIQPHVFETLLKFLYTDNVELISFDMTCELYYAAKKYMLKHLLKRCVKYLEINASFENACKGYEFAKLFEEDVLEEKCLRIIKSQTERVLTNSNLNDLMLDTMLMILDQDGLNIQSEVTLFNVIDNNRYFFSGSHKDGKDPSSSTSANESTCKGPTLKNALGKIRFLTMSPTEFAEGPGKSDLLSNDEKLAILMNISSKSSTIPMPPYLSLET